MGLVKNIKWDAFPKQGECLHRRVVVIFHRDTSQTIEGEIVRDDSEEPFLTIIKLDDGRHVLGRECQYSHK